MKTIIFFSLAFFLCIFKANSAPGPVLDAGGKPLRSGVEYYATPTSIDGFDSSILRAPVGNKTCPAGAVEYYQTEGEGQTLIITPVDPKMGVIRLSTDVNIKFSGPVTRCHESNVWKLQYYKATKQYVVMMGGVEGNPGPETLNNWFKIEKAVDDYNREAYKFVYCPSVCSSCKVMCKDIGTYHGNLVLGGDPLFFNFFYA
ncbi:putative proteinase inhibitor I3, Kunitz legume, kunitz inhibitor STI-like superfamily [Helianthus annuus]|nr:putative proteinase inhibitor I3, Kunitz legume, kunitz inhibitor STI-like superfamily [Helianthus annuus]KAJ0636238.1 putative proteinase inhibitor I3, Kunitz legume, kunitz inhibitor STI-like superfamily [Helianthus annuus]